MCYLLLPCWNSQICTMKPRQALDMVSFSFIFLSFTPSLPFFSLALQQIFPSLEGNVKCCHLSQCCLQKVLLLPQNCIPLLVGVEPKDTTKAKIRRRRDLLPAASKENTRDISQSSVSPDSKIGDVFETEQGPMGLLGTEAFPCPLLLVGNRLQLP